MRPRRELFAAVEERTANFARCGIQRLDEWADAFRVERRMPLPRAVVLLAVAERASGASRPKQQYVANLLEHFEKRVVGRRRCADRWPGLPSARRHPGSICSSSGQRNAAGRAPSSTTCSRAPRCPVTLDPAAYLADERLEGRLRRLVSHALTFRRDTGIDGRT